MRVDLAPTGAECGSNPSDSVCRPICVRQSLMSGPHDRKDPQPGRLRQFGPRLDHHDQAGVDLGSIIGIGGGWSDNCAALCATPG